MIILDEVQTRNMRECRAIVDAWCDERPGLDREGVWVRTVATLWTESKALILAHGGGWSGGNRTNSAQRAVLAKSTELYRAATGRDPDGVGNNGASVGAFQQIPTDAARLRTVDGLDGGAPAPWDGWGDIVECMTLDTATPKFLRLIRVTTDSTYKGKPMASAIVADLLRVQQPAADEVAANYGGSITAAAVDIAGMFPRTPTERDWLDMATKEEVQQAFTDALAPVLQRLDAIEATLTSAEDKPRLSLVRNADTGEIFAYGPGQFDHVGSMEELEYGRNIGIYSRSPWLDTDTGGIEVFRGIATEGSGADKSKES